MSLLSEYLEKVRFIHGAPSTDELSFYPALEELFNSVGNEQTPPVRCIMNLKDIGAGLPDGGLFTADQIPESTAPLFEEEIDAPPPGRGAIEAKSTERSLDDLQASEQVARYLDRYGTVLITNLRAFRLLAPPRRVHHRRHACVPNGLTALLGLSPGLDVWIEYGRLTRVN